MPGIARTVRTLTPAECGKLIARVAQRPRRQVLHPFMLRLYGWSHALVPALPRWLLRVTGPKRRAPGGA